MKNPLLLSSRQQDTEYTVLSKENKALIKRSALATLTFAYCGASFFAAASLGTLDEPLNLSAPETTTRTLTLNWVPISGAAQYQLEEKVQGDVFRIVSTSAQLTQSLERAEGTYEYRILGCIDAGDGQPICNENVAQYSATASVNVGAGPVTEVDIPTAPTIASDPGVSATSASVGAIESAISVNSGNASWSTELVLPAGIGGYQPSIGLAYTSSSANSALGVGWSLVGMSTISRCRKYFEEDGMYQEVTFTDSDQLCLNGERLVLNPNSTHFADGAEYRPKMDPTTKVIFHVSGDNGYFVLHRSNGETWTYGETANAKVSDVASETNYQWLIETKEDTFSNKIEYTYIGSDTAQKHIDKIKYSDNEVDFQYTTRADDSKRYYQGNAIVDNQLLTDIVISNHNDIDINSYHFEHTLSDFSSRNLLTEIARCDGSSSGICLQPTTFEYDDQMDFGLVPESDEIVIKLEDVFGTQNVDADRSSSFCEIDDRDRPHSYCAGKDLALGDTNGDGINEVVVLNGKDQKYYAQALTIGENGYTETGAQLTGDLHEVVTVERNGSVSITHRLYGAGLTVGDTDGDSVDEIMITNSFVGSSGRRDLYADTDGDGLLELANMRDLSGQSRARYNNQEWDSCRNQNQSVLERDYSPHSSIDFNGDGLVDRVFQISARCEGVDHVDLLASEYYVLKNTSIGEEFSETQADFDVNFLDEQNGSGDINGDGYADFDSSDEGGCWTGTGIAGSCFVEHGLGAARHYADLNADGKQDQVFTGNATTPIRVRLSNYGVSPENNALINLGTASWTDVPRDGVSLFWSDLDGDGLPALIYFDKGTQQIHVRNDANTENKKVDSLISVDNGMGLTADFEYVNLAKSNIYTPYADGPTKVWGNESPVFDSQGNFYAVSSLTQSVGSTENGTTLETTTDYQYEGLRVQSGGRGSLGFAKIIETNNSTRNRVVSEYRQDYPFNGRMIAQTRDVMTSSSTYAALSKTTIDEWHDLSFFDGELLYIQEKKRTEVTNTVSGSNGDILTTVTPLNTRVTSTSLLTNKSGEVVDENDYVNIAKRVISTTDHATSAITKETTSYLFGDEDVTNWRIQRPTSMTSTQTLETGKLITDTKTQVQTITYNDKGRVATQANGTVPVADNVVQISQYAQTAYVYDSKGNQTSVTQCSSHYASNCGTRAIPTDTATDKYRFFNRVITAYDINGRYPSSVSNGLYTEMEFADYNALGQPGTVTDAFGVEEYRYYEAFGQQYFAASEDGSYSHSTMGLCSSSCPSNAYYFNSVTTPNAPDVTTFYDVAGREVATRTRSLTNAWMETNNVYDIRGQLIKQTQPHFLSTSANDAFFSYDDAGRMWKSVAADGTEEIMSWSGRTQTTTVSGSHAGAHSSATFSQTEKKTTNGLGQLVTSEDANLKQTTYLYDALGNLAEATNIDGSKIEVSFDSYGRKTQLKDPDKGTVNYVFNGLDTQVERLSPAGDAETSFFDVVGRVVKKTTTSSAGNHTGVYSYTGVNLIYETGSEGMRRDYTYDETFNRLTGVKHTLDGTEWNTSTTYDEYGRVFQEFDTSGSSRGVQYSYQHGYAKSQKEASNKTTVYYDATAMDARGNVTSWKLGNGHTTTAVYDEDTGFLESINSTNGTVAIQDHLYEYDGLGNLRARVDKTGDSNSEQLVEEFDYDKLNRLTKVTFQDVETLTVSYFDNGNIKTKSDVANGAAYAYGAKRTQCSVTPGKHAISSIGTSINYCYDSKGNQTHRYDNGINTREVAYTGYDKPSMIKSQEAETQFNYDTDHQRFKRVDIDDEGTRTTYYVGNNEIVIHDSGLTETKRYIGQHVLDIVRSNGANVTNYLYLDHIGSISVIANASGQLIERLSYDAFGKRRDGLTWNAVQNTIANPSIARALDLTQDGFTGHEHVDHADIIHMGGRIYDQQIGRFAQADPIVQAPQNGQSLNRYSYVFNNPLSYTDPTGYTAQDTCHDQDANCDRKQALDKAEAGQSTVGDQSRENSEQAQQQARTEGMSSGAFSENEPFDQNQFLLDFGKGVLDAVDRALGLLPELDTTGSRITSSCNSIGCLDFSDGFDVNDGALLIGTIGAFFNPGSSNKKSGSKLLSELKEVDFNRLLDDTVDLFRAVGVKEFQSIQQNKAFLPGPGSLEGRQFALSFEEALNFADFDLTKVAIMKVTVERNAIDLFDFSKNIDPFIFRNGVITVQPGKQSQVLIDSTKRIEQAL